jgi:excisionase family DNA binding protein
MTTPRKHLTAGDPLPLRERRPRGRPKRQPDGDLLTLKEAAALLGWGEDRLAAAIREGTAPGYLQGHTFDIRRTWVDAYLRGESGFWSRPYAVALAEAQAEREARMQAEATTRAVVRGVTGFLRDLVADLEATAAVTGATPVRADGFLARRELRATGD